MTLDLNSVLLLFVIFQFMFLGVFLLTSKRGKRISNTLLGLFCVCISISMAELFITLQGIFNVYLVFSFLDLNLFLLHGPLIYLYCRSVIFKDFNISPRGLLHFSPAALMLILTIINFQTTTAQEKLETIEKIYSFKLSLTQMVFVVFFYLHILVYIFYSFRLIKFYRSSVSEDLSALKSYSLKWLDFLIRSFLAVTLLFMALGFVPYSEFPWLARFVLVADIIIAFFIINLILFKALRKPDLFSGVKIPRYAQSNLDTISKEAGLKAIESIMASARPYLEPSLSVNGLAKLLDMKERDVSQIINEKTGMSFHDYINQQRIAYATDLMSQPGDPKITILEVLYQSGFNSKSSFNAAFKKHTGQTPSAFKRSLTTNA